MATIKFFIRSTANPSNIYVRVRNGRKIDLFIPTSLFIDPGHWSASKGRPKNTNTPDLKAVDDGITNIHKDLLTYINKNANTVSKEELIDTVKKESVQKTDENTSHTVDTLLGYYQLHIEYLTNQVKIGKLKSTTISKYRVVMEILKRMEKSNNTTYLINEVGLNFINEFEWYCQNKAKYSPNTIGRAIKFIKTVCLAARSNGKETDPQLDKIKGYTVKSTFVILDEYELNTIEKMNLEAVHLDSARDWLLISCYSAQRVSDFLKFTKLNIEHINSPSNGRVKVISFIQKKTEKAIKLPISKKLEVILIKRNGHFPPTVSEQKYNKQIKEVCKLAGINEKIKNTKMNPKTNRKEQGVFEKWELVTSHIGRRSYATNNYGIIPTPIIMYATGHTTEQMLLKYIGKSEDDKALELLKYTEI